MNQPRRHRIKSHAARSPDFTSPVPLPPNRLQPCIFGSYRKERAGSGSGRDHQRMQAPAGGRRSRRWYRPRLCRTTRTRASLLQHRPVPPPTPIARRARPPPSPHGRRAFRRAGPPLPMRFPNRPGHRVPRRRRTVHPQTGPPTAPGVGDGVRLPHARGVANVRLERLDRGGNFVGRAVPAAPSEPATKAWANPHGVRNLLKTRTHESTRAQLSSIGRSVGKSPSPPTSRGTLSRYVSYSAPSCFRRPRSSPATYRIRTCRAPTGSTGFRRRG